MVMCLNCRLIAMQHNVTAKLSIFVHMKSLNARFDTKFLSSFLVHFD